MLNACAILSGQRRLLLLAGIAFGLFAGCSSSTIPRTYPAKGKVVFKGGKAVSGGTIELVSLSDPGLRAFGDIDSDGTFKLTALKDREEKPGVVEGEYEVFVELQSDRDERPGADPDKGGDGRIAVGKRTLTAGKNELLIEITAPRRR